MKKLKLYLSLTLLILTINLSYSQVGINTENPAATLDIVATSTDTSTAEGFIAPRLTGEQLASKNSQYKSAHNAAIVYVTEADPKAIGKTKNITTSGYYYYDANADNGTGANSGLWIPLTSARKQQFYIPSIILPTNASDLPDPTLYSYSEGIFTVKLFEVYKKQYGTPQVKSDASASLSLSSSASDFNYFVLYYDPSVFNSVTITPSGYLNYALADGYVLSEKTFMNIMFREK